MKKTTLAAVAACLLLLISLSTGCKSDKPAPPPPAVDTPAKPEVKVPRFNRDSAYAYIEKQVAFGPRVPNTAAHRACAAWLESKLKSMDVKVIAQNFEASAYDGTRLKGVNFIASYKPEHPTRILLAAHWDSRHISDHDPDEANRDKPVLGADDGGSGVGVLIEVLRTLKENPLDLGVDVVLFDLEDYGEGGGTGNINSWCLGSQYWGNNLHVAGYRAKYGILLDMVGAKNARFTKEGTSMQYAPRIMHKVWRLAQDLGYGAYFVNDPTSPITDDHLFVNKITGIPTIDIINRPVDSKTGFGHYWHTQKDDMSVIDKRTLRAVGQTVITVLYQESAGNF
ncbi:MAG: M28 family peptidase [Bacteroidota bacterium]